jgi:small nuclear ribonucleoprotein (snRNP)-like protein
LTEQVQTCENLSMVNYMESEMNDECRAVAVQDVPYGEYVKRKPDSKKVYIRGEYIREEKAYWLQDADDISKGMLVKGDKIVYIGFTY